MSAPLTASELRRYERHIILPELGREGQQKIKDGSVLIVGTGGLGSPLALYLAAAGVGRIGLVDFDIVDESNLQRQIIHFTSDVGTPKLESAKRKILEINPNAIVETHNVALKSDNALDILKNYDVIVDGTDNFPTRYLVADACTILNKPNVYGSIFRFEGQVTVFNYQDGPSYRCLYPEPPPPGLVPSCAEGGVLGVLPGVVGTLQATEVIKILTGIGTPLKGRLLLYNALDLTFKTVKVRRDPKWAVGTPHPTVTKLVDYEQFCGLKRGGEVSDEISVAELKEWRDQGRSFTLIDVREENEYEYANIGGKLIPLGEVVARQSEIPREGVVVLQCKVGGRSRQALEALKAQGYNNLLNLAGGIAAWSREIDPSVPRY
ncbi:MAG: molybdopterin-synthase adenylyltransferase MoeB [Fibrobacteria bacterium]|nr:molybdopterin-synthase adenylyltransferase MoeB [Fibrobacteria bacterium]